MGPNLELVQAPTFCTAAPCVCTTCKRMLSGKYMNSVFQRFICLSDAYYKPLAHKEHILSFVSAHTRVSTHNSTHSVYYCVYYGKESGQSLVSQKLLLEACVRRRGALVNVLWTTRPESIDNLAIFRVLRAPAVRRRRRRAFALRGPRSAFAHFAVCDCVVRAARGLDTLWLGGGTGGFNGP